MCRSLLNIFRLALCGALLICSYRSSALEFEPGIGVGLEYTDNARLTPDNQVDDLIVVGYIGGKLEKPDGPVTADISAALNHHRYTNDTFEDKRYFNLGAAAGWEMIKNRFNWFLGNIYRQRPVNTTDPNTPDNIQDSNIFSLGADILFQISARQSFALRPEYRNFYFEVQATDNQQLALVARWIYQLNSVTSLGVDASVRTIDYDLSIIDDVTFSSIFFVVSGSRARSDYSTNLGATYVQRSNGQSTEEFAGNLDWMVNLTSRSRVRAYLSTDLIDTSTGTLNATIDPDVGDPNDIQVTTDVIRNQVMTLGYRRTDGTLESSLSGSLRRLNYSESPNDRNIRSLNGVFNYPVTALLSSGIYARYSDTDFDDRDRNDKRYTIGGNIQYQLSRNLRGLIDLKYRKKESTLARENFDELSAFASLVYGFGEALRPTRTGGF